MHRAASENPEYITTLANLGEAVNDIVSPPLTPEEQTNWYEKRIALFSSKQVDRARGSMSWISNDALVGLVGSTATSILSANYFDTFRHPSGHDQAISNMNESFGSVGLPQIGRSEHVLAYTEEMNGHAYARFLPVWPGVMAYHGALTTITNRLRSEEAELHASLAIGNTMEHELLARVHERAVGRTPKRAAIDSFTEGYDSIAFAGAHLELGGFQAENPQQFCKAVLGYTASIPGGGLLAPMALRGQYFQKLVSKEGRIDLRYKEVFDSIRQERRGRRESIEPYEEKDDPIGPPYDPEYCNNNGFPHADWERYTPEYDGEGCPGILANIIRNAALLFTDKVNEFSSLAHPQIETVDFESLFEAATKASNRWR